MVAIGGIVMALTPTILDGISGEAVSAVSGSSLAIFVTIATVVQLLTRRITAFSASVAGAGVSVVGACAVLLSVSTASMPLVLAGMAVMGTGAGLAFRGTLALAEYMSQPGNRASVISAYNVVMYAGLSLPTLAAGALADRVGIWSTLLVATTIAVTLALPASVYGLRRLAPSLRI